jgi:outer membrane protein assembly factor BamB
VDLSGAGRRLLGVPGSDRLAALDPASGVELWTAPITRHCTLALAPAVGFVVAQGPRHLGAYSLEDGRRAWERESQDRLVPSGGRLWIARTGASFLLELDPLTGGEKKALALEGPLVAIIPQRSFVDLVVQHEALRLRARDLAPEWRTPLPAPALAAAGDARTLFVSGGDDHGRVLLLDAAGGRLLADEPADRFSTRETSLENPGFVLQSSRTQDGLTLLLAFDRRDGRLAWKESVEEHERGGTRDTLLVQRESRLLLVDPGARAERWSRALDGAWKASARRGDAVVLGTERSISGIQAASGHETWRIELAPPAAEIRFAASNVKR